jgi:biopolymer transport protein ExbD
MKMTSLAAPAILAAASFVADSAAVHAANRPEPETPVSISVRLNPASACEVQLPGQSFIVPEENNELIAALQKFKGRSLLIKNTNETPFRCVEMVIDLAPRAGFRKLGFISEPTD